MRTPRLTAARAGYQAFTETLTRLASACQCLGCGRRRPARMSAAYDSETPSVEASPFPLQSKPPCTGAGDLTGATSGQGEMRYSDLKPVLLPSGKPSANDFHHLTQVSIARCVGLYFISTPSCALRSISFPIKTTRATIIGGNGERWTTGGFR